MRAYAHKNPEAILRVTDGDAIPDGYTADTPPAAISGHAREYIDGEWQKVPIPEPEHEPEPTPEQIREEKLAEVNFERNRRLAADFEFQGVMYQRDSVSLQRIAGAAQIASIAIAAGAQPDDMRWHGGASDFGWIASDDTVTPMDAQTVVAFGMAAAARETSLVFAARNLRNMDDVPEDFTDDKYWPQQIAPAGYASQSSGERDFV